MPDSANQCRFTELLRQLVVTAIYVLCLSGLSSHFFGQRDGWSSSGLALAVLLIGGKAQVFVRQTARIL